MSRSAIYTANTTPTALAVGNIIPVGTTVRRFGKCIRQDGNTITLAGPGYYLVNASATAAPTAAGTVSVTGQKDGVAVIGATAAATTTAAAESANPLYVASSRVFLSFADFLQTYFLLWTYASSFAMYCLSSSSRSCWYIFRVVEMSA